jgi:hypothetical protein
MQAEMITSSVVAEWRRPKTVILKLNRVEETPIDKFKDLPVAIVTSMSRTRQISQRITAIKLLTAPDIELPTATNPIPAGSLPQLRCPYDALCINGESNHGFASAGMNPDVSLAQIDGR